MEIFDAIASLSEHFVEIFYGETQVWQLRDHGSVCAPGPTCERGTIPTTAHRPGSPGTSSFHGRMRRRRSVPEPVKIRRNGQLLDHLTLCCGPDAWERSPPIALREGREFGCWIGIVPFHALRVTQPAWKYWIQLLHYQGRAVLQTDPRKPPNFGPHIMRLSADRPPSRMNTCKKR